MLNFVTKFIILNIGDEMNKDNPKIIMIVGPTAVGKSDLGVKLAQTVGGEVVNGDAYQIYREMAIGTAKITPAEMNGVPHHLYDIVSVKANFSVAQFMRRAIEAIDAILTRGNVPILVGGTGFYLNALRLGLPLGGDAPPSHAREVWQAALAQHDQTWLWQQLEQRDAAAAANIPVGNSRRVIRALEVIETTGQLFSAQPENNPQFQTRVIGLTTERALLYQRINQRVDLMMQAGLLDEVKRVLALAGPDAQALKAIGYKEFLPYLNGDMTLSTAVEQVKQNSRRYAKRQLTFFRHQMPTQWFDLVQQPESLADITQQTRDWLTR